MKKKKKIPVRLPTAPPSIKHKDAKKYDRKRDKKNFPMENLSIKEYFNIREDLDLSVMSPSIVGLYSFCQALNKVGNQSPYPVPTVDIVSTNETGEGLSNPVDFTYSGNSFKVYINPKISKISLRGRGHDIIHAITTNIAKNFGRRRPMKAGQEVEFGEPTNGTSSRSNLRRVSFKNFEPFADELRFLGIDYRSLKTPKDIRDAISQLNNRLNMSKDQFEINLIHRLLRLLPKAFRDHWGPRIDIEKGNKKDKSFRKYIDNYKEKYGRIDTLFKTFEGLPQNESEEDFGNLINEQIMESIEGSLAIDIEKAIYSLKDLTMLNGSEDLMSHLNREWFSKFENFLVLLFETYNKLLPKYKSISEKNYIQETRHAKDRAAQRLAGISDKEIDNIQIGLERLSSAIARAGRKPAEFFEVEKPYVIKRGRGMLVVILPDRGTTAYPTLRIATVLGPGQEPRGEYEMFMPIAQRVGRELSGLKS